MRRRLLELKIIADEPNIDEGSDNNKVENIRHIVAFPVVGDDDGSLTTLTADDSLGGVEASGSFVSIFAGINSRTNSKCIVVKDLLSLTSKATVIAMNYYEGFVEFAGWSVNGDMYSSSEILTIGGNTQYIYVRAHFKKVRDLPKKLVNVFPISTNNPSGIWSDERGSVTMSPMTDTVHNGIVKRYYDENSTATSFSMNATPEAGYEYGYWSVNGVMDNNSIGKGTYTYSTNQFANIRHYFKTPGEVINTKVKVTAYAVDVNTGKIMTDVKVSINGTCYGNYTYVYVDGGRISFEIQNIQNPETKYCLIKSSDNGVTTEWNVPLTARNSHCYQDTIVVFYLDLLDNYTGYALKKPIYLIKVNNDVMFGDQVENLRFCWHYCFTNNGNKYYAMPHIDYSSIQPPQDAIICVKKNTPFEGVVYLWNDNVTVTKWAVVDYDFYQYGISQDFQTAHNREATFYDSTTIDYTKHSLNLMINGETYKEYVLMPIIAPVGNGLEPMKKGTKDDRRIIFDISVRYSGSDTPIPTFIKKENNGEDNILKLYYNNVSYRGINFVDENFAMIDVYFSRVPKLSVNILKEVSSKYKLLSYIKNDKLTIVDQIGSAVDIDNTENGLTTALYPTTHLVLIYGDINKYYLNVNVHDGIQVKMDSNLVTGINNTFELNRGSSVSYTFTINSLNDYDYVSVSYSSYSNNYGWTASVTSMHKMYVGDSFVFSNDNVLSDASLNLYGHHESGGGDGPNIPTPTTYRVVAIAVGDTWSADVKPDSRYKNMISITSPASTTNSDGAIECSGLSGTTTIKLKATPTNGATFLGWTVNEEAMGEVFYTSINTDYELSVTGETFIRAHFKS